jgi:hypothetical protein
MRSASVNIFYYLRPPGLKRKDTDDINAIAGETYRQLVLFLRGSRSRTRRVAGFFGGYPAGFTRRLPDAGLNSLHQVYRADDPPTRALLLGYAGHALDLTISIPIFAATPAW